MTSVLIGSNEPVLARGLEAILTGGGLEVTDVCADVVQLFESIQRQMPDALILDGSITPLRGVLADLRRRVPRSKILVWPAQVSETEARELIASGAACVIPSNVTPTALINALDLVGSFPPAEATPADFVRDTCSPWEMRALSLVGRGMSNSEIAAVMHSDSRTVDRSLRALSRKLGAHDRFELTLYGFSIAGETSHSMAERS